MNNFELSQKVSRKLKLLKLNATKVFKGQELIAIYYGSYKVVEKAIYDIKKDDPAGVDIDLKRTKLYPDFSTDMNTAWVLVMEMKANGWNYQFGDVEILDGYVSAEFYTLNSCFEAQHKHMPTAILRTAAKALGVLDE